MSPASHGNEDGRRGDEDGRRGNKEPDLLKTAIGCFTYCCMAPRSLSKYSILQEFGFSRMQGISGNRLTNAIRFAQEWADGCRMCQGNRLNGVKKTNRNGTFFPCNKEIIGLL